jgi:5'-nucleotidase
MLEQQWSVSGGMERAMVLAPSRGVAYAWDPARPIGDRIDPASIRIAGAPLDLTASYRITVNSFLADGGDGFTVLRNGTDRRAGPVDLDPLAAHLSSQMPFPAPALGRIRRVAS